MNLGQAPTSQHSWTSTLHYIDLHSMAHTSYVVDMTHDTTQHETVLGPYTTSVTPYFY